MLVEFFGEPADKAIWQPPRSATRSLGQSQSQHQVIEDLFERIVITI